MNRAGVLLLGVLALAAITAVLVLTPARREESIPAGEPLLSGLKEIVNELEALDLSAAGGEVRVRLRRDEQRWRVLERDGYEADFERVRSLLRSLAEARRAEPRTADPRWYARLGVEDVAAPDASGIRLDFPGTGLPGLIIGRADPAGRGHYARVAGAAQSWLIDREFDLEADPVAWLERSVMDLPASEIREVVIRHPDGDIVHLKSGDTDGGEFVLFNVPAGRSAGPAWNISPVANGLSRVRLEDVRAHDGNLPDDAVRALYTTIDGLNFVASLFADASGNWVHFTVSAETPVRPEGEEPDADQTEALVDAVAVDARLSPWQFRLSEFKYDNLSRRLEDLLEPVED